MQKTSPKNVGDVLAHKKFELERKRQEDEIAHLTETIAGKNREILAMKATIDAVSLTANM